MMESSKPLNWWKEEDVYIEVDVGEGLLALVNKGKIYGFKSYYLKESVKITLEQAKLYSDKAGYPLENDFEERTIITKDSLFQEMTMKLNEINQSNIKEMRYREIEELYNSYMINYHRTLRDRNLPETINGRKVFYQDVAEEVWEYNDISSIPLGKYNEWFEEYQKRQKRVGILSVTAT